MQSKLPVPQWLWLAALSLAPTPVAAQAADAGTITAQQTTSKSTGPISGWEELLDRLRVLPHDLLAKLPPEERDDPQFRAEVGQLMLASLASSALTALNSDGDHPAFVPLFGQVLNLARPNADTIYRTAEITPGGTYRLRGRAGTATLVKIGEGGSATYHDLNALPVDKEGRYDVILSPERPGDYKGAWWKTARRTSSLLLRMVSNDWGSETDPTVSIERIDRPVRRPRPSAAELEARLRKLPQVVSSLAKMRMGWITQLRQQGFLHKPKLMQYSEAGLLVGQAYYEAAYDLKDDEALLIETEVPKRCPYHSIILTTEMGGTVDWTNNHSSLNGSQITVDRDGILRIVVSARDPGVLNWLDTAGYSQGGIQGRWTDCSSQPVPKMRKIALSKVRKFLLPETPVVTPEQRERIVRERRAAFQQRPLW